MPKYYYENILSNQNLTVKINIAWVADITTLDLFIDQKVYVFLCIDIHTNFIIAYTISKKPIGADKIVRSLEIAIIKRFKVPGTKKLIIHTDRGTQFASKTYNNFVNRYQDYFVTSISRENTPTDNAVGERFMRTFKQHKINNTS